MTEPTIAERYADFAAGLCLEDVPAALIEKAKLHILDTLGCAIAASRTDFAASVLAALTRLEGGSGSVAVGQAGTLAFMDIVRTERFGDVLNLSSTVQLISRAA